MDKKSRLIAGGAITLGLVAGGATFAIAAGGAGDSDTPLAGSDLDRATAAALAEVGQGTVVDSEIGDDGAAYSVEVQLADGRVVEVNLDQRFQVTGSTADEDTPNEQESGEGSEGSS
jgi:hypothetical protein